MAQLERFMPVYAHRESSPDTPQSVWGKTNLTAGVCQHSHDAFLLLHCLVAKAQDVNIVAKPNWSVSDTNFTQDTLTELRITE